MNQVDIYELWTGRNGLLDQPSLLQPSGVLQVGLSAPFCQFCLASQTDLLPCFYFLWTWCPSYFSILGRHTIPHPLCGYFNLFRVSLNDSEVTSNAWRKVETRIQEESIILPVLHSFPWRSLRTCALKSKAVSHPDEKGSWAFGDGKWPLGSYWAGKT